LHTSVYCTDPDEAGATSSEAISEAPSPQAEPTKPAPFSSQVGSEAPESAAVETEKTTDESTGELPEGEMEDNATTCVADTASPADLEREEGVASPLKTPPPKPAPLDMLPLSDADPPTGESVRSVLRLALRLLNLLQ
jgi:hypothetical protein